MEIIKTNSISLHKASIQNPSPSGEKEYLFTIPENERYHRSKLELLETVSGNAFISEQPEEGSFGNLKIKVKWQVNSSNPPGMVKYLLQVFAVRIPGFTYARFKTENGKYITAVNGGGSGLTATGNSSDPFGLFILVNLNGGELNGKNSINLLSADGHWVASENNGGIKAGSFVVNKPETFTIYNYNSPSTATEIEDLSSIIIKTSEGKALRIDTVNGDTIVADSYAVTSSCSIILEIIPGFDIETPNTGLKPASPLNYFVNTVRNFVKNNEIPAGAIAIFKNGSPAFLQGYGYLDKLKTNLTLPSSIMLIASIDKHITSVTIETWIKQSGGNINKHTKYFPFLRSLGVQPSGVSADARLDKINFAHLLSGTSGLKTSRPSYLLTPDEQASWLMVNGWDSDAGTNYHYPNLENELLRFAVFKDKGGRNQFVRFLNDEVLGIPGSNEIDLYADSADELNRREPTWYKGANHRYPNRALLLTSSVEALGILFSKYRQSDGRPIGKDVPALNAIEIISNNSSTAPIRINCGGDNYNASGINWEADSNFNPNNSWTGTVNSGILNIDTDVLYQTVRAGNIEYSFVVPDGTYTVTLKFAETWHSGAGQRLFSLWINDETALSDFDIFTEAGGKYTAIDKTFQVAAENNEGLKIRAYPSGRHIYWGGFGGTTALVDQMTNQKIINIALFNKNNLTGNIADILFADTLIGTQWP